MWVKLRKSFFPAFPVSLPFDENKANDKTKIKVRHINIRFMVFILIILLSRLSESFRYSQISIIKLNIINHL